jgi:hypothetical protein
LRQRCAPRIDTIVRPLRTIVRRITITDWMAMRT